MHYYAFTQADIQHTIRNAKSDGELSKPRYSAFPSTLDIRHSH
jgi:hypothetical protein